MIKAIVKRLLAMLVSLFLIMSFTFFLMHLAPGNPFSDDRNLAPEALHALESYYKLDLSIFAQFTHYLSEFAQGHFGPSFTYGLTPVEELIWAGFPVSLILGLQAFVFAVFFGYAIGILSALKRTSLLDGWFFTCSILGMAIPSFLIASLLQYLFAIEWPILPLGRWGGFSHTILPTLSLAALPATFIAKLARSNTLECLQEDYIELAKSKGLHPRTILLKHALRNSCIPVVSYLGPLFASIITGSFVIEHLFHIPGIGQLFVTSVTNRDYPLIMAITTFYGALLLGSVFVIDLFYHFIDPRIRKEGAI